MSNRDIPQARYFLTPKMESFAAIVHEGMPSVRLFRNYNGEIEYMNWIENPVQALGSALNYVQCGKWTETNKEGVYGVEINHDVPQTINNEAW